MAVRKVAGAAVRAGLWVVAVAALAPSVAAANDDERAARITYFEPLHALPSAAGSAEQQEPARLQQLHFDAFGRRFDISLGSNDAAHGEQAGAVAHSSCTRGSIDGIAGSWVRLATKGDVLHGMMWDGTQLYAIEPAAEVRDCAGAAPPPDASQTIVFRLADVTMDQGAAACASESAPTKASDAFDALATELKGTTLAMQATGATRRLDVSALGDAQFPPRYGNEQDARDAILTRLNNVDGIFSSQLAIEIHVGTLSVPDAASDQLSAATAPNSLLRELAQPAQAHAGAELAGRDAPVHRSQSRRQHDRHRVPRLAVRQPERRRPHRVAQRLAGLAGRGARDGPQLRRGPRRRLEGQLPEHALLRLPHGAGRERDRRFLAVQPDRMRQRTQHASCITQPPPANVRIPAASARAPAARHVVHVAADDHEHRRPDLAQRARELTLPAALTIVDASVIGGSCTSGGGAVECELGDIAGGNVRTIELELSGDAAGSNTITAHVSADNDSTAADNDGSGAIVIEAPADVSVTLHGPATATGERDFTVGFQSREHRGRQRRNGHGEDRHSRRARRRQRFAGQRQLHERRYADRVHARAARRRRRRRAARCR